MSSAILWTFVAAFAASFGGVVWFRQYALSRRLLDVPNARSSHRIPTPRGGGGAIALVSCLGTMILWAANLTTSDVVVGVAAPSMAVAAIGFLDDHGHLSARVRLIVHFTAAAWTIFWLGGLVSIGFGHATIALGVAGYPLAAVMVVWVLNLFNFMDGIDGLAGSELVFVAAASAWLAGHDSAAFMPFVLLAGAGAGFLILNWPPARVFMGDVGSGFIGFALIALAFIAYGEDSLPIWTSITLMGVFVTDATVTLLRRMARGERVQEAHRTHAYQQVARRRKAHKPVTLGVFAINVAWLLPWAYASKQVPEYALVLCLTALIPLAVVAIVLGAGSAEADTSFGM